MTMDGFAQEMLEADVSLARLGIEVTSAHDGSASATLTVTPDMANGHGICHGGLVFALADTVFAFAANSLNAGTATAEASMNFLAPAFIGDVLVADATVAFRGSRRMVVDVAVRAGDRTVALYRGTGRTIRSAA